MIVLPQRSVPQRKQGETCSCKNSTFTGGDAWSFAASFMALVVGLGFYTQWMWPDIRATLAPPPKRVLVEAPAEIIVVEELPKIETEKPEELEPAPEYPGQDSGHRLGAKDRRAV